MKKIATTLLAIFSSAIALSQTSDNVARTFAFNYSFITPENWTTHQKKEYSMLAQSQNSEVGCIILIFPPQPSSGDLQNDAISVFNQMYAGWQFRSTGEKRYDVSRGYTLQGLEYYKMEAGMSKLSEDGSRYEGFEDGGALVIKTGKQIAIIATRHTIMTAHTDCLNKYETWRRFFNSFTIIDAIILKNTEEESSKRIIGIWALVSNGPVLGEYIFAANGNYQLAGAIGTLSTTTDYRYEYLHLTSYSFQGDGSYSIKGNQILFRKHGDKNSEQVKFRFEKVDHGDTGWKDRLCLLKTDPTLGSKYEACYEKKGTLASGRDG